MSVLSLLMDDAVRGSVPVDLGPNSSACEKSFLFLKVFVPKEA